MFSPLTMQLIEHLRCLPGVGPKSAQRMAFHLLGRNRDSGLLLAKALEQAIHRVAHCPQCRTFSETEFCTLCANPNRNANMLCVIETPADIIAIEQTGSYRGYYFVLRGHLSPIDGIGPHELGIDKLMQRLEQTEIKEVILATNSTVEGEATAHYIVERLQQKNIKCTRLAHGVPMGGELEYLDGGTLARAITARTTMSHYSDG